MIGCHRERGLLSGVTYLVQYRNRRDSRGGKRYGRNDDSYATCSIRQTGVEEDEADAIQIRTKRLSYADILHLLSNSQVNLCRGSHFQIDYYKDRIFIIAAYGG